MHEHVQNKTYNIPFSLVCTINIQGHFLLKAFVDFSFPKSRYSTLNHHLLIHAIRVHIFPRKPSFHYIQFLSMRPCCLHSMLPGQVVKNHKPHPLTPPDTRSCYHWSFGLSISFPRGKCVAAISFFSFKTLKLGFGLANE